MIVILKKKKGKSAQYRFLFEHRIELTRLLKMNGFPSNRGFPVFPLLASSDTASVKEFTSFEPKIKHLPQDPKKRIGG